MQSKSINAQVVVMEATLVALSQMEMVELGVDTIPQGRVSSHTKKFKTYADCKRFIVKNRLIGYAPQLPHCKGLGEFDKSWNWLMPVVAKIYTLGYHTEITATCCEIKKVWGSRSLP